MLGCCALAAACEARGQWKLALASCMRSVEEGRSTPISDTQCKRMQAAPSSRVSSSPAQVWGRTRPWQERGSQLAALPTFGRQGPKLPLRFLCRKRGCFEPAQAATKIIFNSMVDASLRVDVISFGAALHACELGGCWHSSLRVLAAKATHCRSHCEACRK